MSFGLHNALASGHPRLTNAAVSARSDAMLPYLGFHAADADLST